jgi:hypothetical protein
MIGYHRYKPSLLDVCGGGLGELIGDPIIHMLIEGLNGFVYGVDLLGLLIGDIEAEVLLHCDDQLHNVERVEPQFLESGGSGQLVLFALCGLRYYAELPSSAPGRSWLRLTPIGQCSMAPMLM